MLNALHGQNAQNEAQLQRWNGGTYLALSKWASALGRRLVWQNE